MAQQCKDAATFLVIPELCVTAFDWVKLNKLNFDAIEMVTGNELNLP